MSTRSRLVIDASAVLALVLDPGDRGAAVAEHVRPATLLAPNLLPFEVANVIRRRWAGGLLSLQDAERALHGLRQLPVTWWTFEHVADLVWARRGAISAYDAAYAALAELLRCPLLTADARLASAPGLGAEVLLVDG